MENHDYEDDFIINLSIENTEFEEVEVKVEDPNRTIRDLINNIIREFDLPKMGEDGKPYSYFLGRPVGGDNPEIFKFEDENGFELCLLDNNVLPGDHITLVRDIWAG